MSNERSTDQFVRDMLKDIGFARPWEQGGGQNGAPKYLYDALKGASKSIGGGYGKPEFMVESGRFIVVIEDKGAIDKSKLLIDGTLDLSYPARNDYALNGAVHYATHIAEKTGKPVFAVGVAGAETHHEVTVAFIAPRIEPKLLAEVDALTDLAPDAIDEYYRVAVKGELPREEREAREIRKVAAELHEEMRNYASLEGERKATLVSAILLALKFKPDILDELKGEKKTRYTDGAKVFTAAEEYLREADLERHQKIGTLLDQFSFIKEHVLLNSPNKDLGNVTPMRRFVEILDREVLHAVSNPSYTAFDVLGNFYGEFVRYGGSDGNALGIVLTPHHITDLMAELIDVDADDYVIDPCAGTAAFLISGMRRMFHDAEKRYANDSDTLANELEAIKKDRLHGVELQDKLFAIGTTNMILRGDGKANFQRHSIFELTNKELRGDHGFTKALINPPYSQSKNKETRHLSELSFLKRTLSLLNRRGRMAAIVPHSAMVGKTKEDKYIKAEILKAHTLDAVITMNPETFHGVGTHVVIALFTAGLPHPASKKTAFVNFKDDGYYVRQHVGLIGDGNEKSRRKHLLEVLNDGVSDDTSFLVRSEVNVADEWHHSYFYFNDQPPTYADFCKVVADYVTWLVDMHTHGFGDLITPRTDADETTPPTKEPLVDCDADAELPVLSYEPMFITDVFETMKASAAWYDKSKLVMGTEFLFPFVSRTRTGNGIDGFCSAQDKVAENGNAITIGLDTQTVAYQRVPFYTSQNIQVLRHEKLNEMNGLVLVGAIQQQMRKFSWGGNGATLGRLRKTRIMVPSTSDEEGNQSVDWEGMTRYGHIVRARSERKIRAAMVIRS